ncbi:MAG: hypothetical protein EOP87_08970, partial [Verrucomicrobiaceae bacterium]
MKTASLVLGWMAAALLSAATATAGDLEKDWEVKQIGGTDYIPLGKFGNFYGFGEMERNGAEIRFEVERKIRVDFKIGSKDCQFNKVRIVLEKEIVEDGDQVFLSRDDFSRLIDPILRPDQIGGAGRFTTVILDAAGAEDPAGDAARHALVIAEKAKVIM